MTHAIHLDVWHLHTQVGLHLYIQSHSSQHKKRRGRREEEEAPLPKRERERGFKVCLEPRSNLPASLFFFVFIYIYIYSPLFSLHVSHFSLLMVTFTLSFSHLFFYAILNALESVKKSQNSLSLKSWMITQVKILSLMDLIFIPMFCIWCLWFVQYHAWKWSLEAI